MTKNSQLIWAESYHLGIQDLLEIQESMAEQIAAAIEPELARTEREAAVRRPPNTMEVWDLYQRGLWLLWGFTTPGLAEAESVFRSAIALDPNFARAHGALAYVKLLRLGTESPSERLNILDEALQDGRAALSLDNQDCMNLCVVGRIRCFQHEYEEAIAYLEDAIAVNPSFAQAYFALGFTLIACGRAKDAIPSLERAQTLSPRDPHLAAFHHARALAHLSLGEFNEAILFARNTTRVPNPTHQGFAVLASVLGLVDRLEEAERTVRALLAVRPNYCLLTAEEEMFFCNDSLLVTRFLEGLKKAGLTDSTSQSATLDRPTET